VSAEATAAVRNLTLRGVEVPPTERFVLYAIANYADEYGKCWPGLNAIMVYTGLSRRTIIRAIADLKDRGLLSTEERTRDNGSRTSNRYMMNFMYAEWKPEVSLRHPPGANVTPPPCQDGTPPVSRWHPQNYSLEETIEETKNLQSNVDSQNANAKNKPTTVSAAPTIAQINELIEAWNANRGTLPAVKTIGEARKRKLRSVIKQHNGQAVALIRDATKQVSNNPFWQQNRYTLDNLLAGEKYLGHAEAFRNENEQRIARRNIDTEVPF
jgi:hypothetical protein